MTRKRGRPAADQATATAAAAGELPPDLDELDPQAVIAELGPEAVLVTLYRQDPSAPSRFAYIDSFPADGFSLDAIRNSYGGGNYRLHIRDSGRKVKRQFGFTIDSRFKPPPTEPAPLVPAGAAPRAVDPQVAELREGMKALQETVRTLAGAVQRPAADPMELAVKIAAGFQAAQQAAFTQLAAMQEGKGAKGASVADLRELLLEGVRIGEDRAGAKGGDPMLETVNRLGPPLLNLIDRGLRQEQAQRGANGHPQPLPAANPPPAPAAPTVAAGAPPVTVPTWQDRVRQHLPGLLFMARADVDPEPLAATVAQALPDQDADGLAELLAQPDALPQLLLIVPELGAYEGWTARLLEALALELEVGPIEPAAPAEGAEHAGG